MSVITLISPSKTELNLITKHKDIIYHMHIICIINADMQCMYTYIMKISFITYSHQNSGKSSKSGTISINLNKTNLNDIFYYIKKKKGMYCLNET